MDKKWYRSSTLWLNVGLGVAIAVLESLQVSIPPQYAVLVTAGLNFLNRFRTTTALTR